LNYNVDGFELKQRRNQLGISQQQLADATGIPKGSIGRIEASGELIKKVDVLKALNEYFKIETKNQPRLEAKPLRLADPLGYEATGDKIYELNDGSLMMEVPVITQRAYAGYLRGFSDPEFYEDLVTIPVMVDRRAFSTYMAFEVYGDSMVCLDNYDLADKSIFPGRIAVGRLLDKSKWQYKLHTHNYDAWIIVHKTEGILIKTITHHDVENGIITIHSLNPNYKDENLQLDDIEQIFSIIKIEQKKR